MVKTLGVWPSEQGAGSPFKYGRASGHSGWRSRSARILPLIFFCVLFFIGGCGAQENIDVSFSGKPSYYLDAYVNRSRPEVHVYPVTDVGGVKVLFVPFKVVQKMDDPEMVGYSVARSFWQTWAGMEVFEQFEFFAEAGPFRRDLAVEYARARGADMVVGGYITHIFAGGNSSDNRLSVQIEAYDVSSRLLVWSMSQGGALSAPKTRDYIIFATKRRMPTDSMQLVTKTLAEDMGVILKEWATREPNYDEFGQVVSDEEQSKKESNRK